MLEQRGFSKRIGLREVLSGLLSEEGYKVRTCAKAVEALDNLREILPDIVVTDLKMAELNGIELMKRIRIIDNTIPVILITAYGTVSSAVQAIKEGAYDYLTKPIDYDRLKILIKRALNERKIKRKIQSEFFNRKKQCHAEGIQPGEYRCTIIIECIDSGRKRHRKRADSQGLILRQLKKRKAVSCSGLFGTA